MRLVQESTLGPLPVRRCVHLFRIASRWPFPSLNFFRVVAIVLAAANPSLQVNAICHHLSHSVWQEQTESLVRGLTASSLATFDRTEKSLDMQQQVRTSIAQPTTHRARPHWSGHDAVSITNVHHERFFIHCVGCSFWSFRCNVDWTGGVTRVG